MTLKVATFNANSIRARLGIVLQWLEQESPDFLGIQETKVQDKDFPVSAFEEAGYHVAYRGQKSYNGVAALTRVPASDVRLNLSDSGPDGQARFIGLKIGSLRFINVYVPQGTAVGTDNFKKKLQWLQDLGAHLRAGYDPQSPLLVTGDFNVALDARDVHDPEGLQGRVCFHPEERKLMQEILDWGLVDVFRKHQPDPGHYTFWDYRIPNAVKRNMGWRIDYILATRSLADACTGARIDTAARHLPRPSDHTFLVADFHP